MRDFKFMAPTSDFELAATSLPWYYISIARQTAGACWSNLSQGKQEVVEQAKVTPVRRIEAILHKALAPSSLSVLDESHLHAGHAHIIKQKAPLSKQIGSAAASGGTHFRIKRVSEAFRGKSRIDRHRIINQLLRQEFEGSLHALAIEAKAPAE